MKKEQWNFWLEVNKHELGETTQHFLRDAVLHAVGRNEVTFILNNKERSKYQGSKRFDFRTRI